MATIYPLKPGQLFEVPSTDKTTLCKMCFEPSVPKGDLDLGALYQYGNPLPGLDDFEVYSAHYYCLLFSSGLETKGEDDEGIKGFLPADIFREWKRGQRLRCTYCGETYGTIGCASRSCRKTFHMSCGMRNGCHREFYGNYFCYCKQHRPEQAIYTDEKVFDISRECGMCFEDMPVIKTLTEDERRKYLWTPCCSKWFHFDCVQKMASNAGYFFKCPMCNNRDMFEAEMKKFGIYVPEQDAAWEREGNMYDGIYERHDTCDAEVCACPDGRKFDEDYTIWEIVLCKYCGAKGTHVKCGDLPLRDDVTWKCEQCRDVIKKMPPRTKHNFRKMRRKKSSRKGIMSRILRKSTIRLNGDDVMSFKTNIFEVSSTLCPTYEVPLPVKVTKADKPEKLEDTVVDAIAQAVSPVKELTATENCMTELSTTECCTSTKTCSPTKEITSTETGSLTSEEASTEVICTPTKNSSLIIKRPLSSGKKLLINKSPVKNHLSLENDSMTTDESMKQSSILSFFAAGDIQAKKT